MECLLFGGAESVGKSSAIYRLARNLIGLSVSGVASPYSTFTVVAGNVPPTFRDFHAVLEGTNKEGQVVRIIINSPTDKPAIIKHFKTFYDNNGAYDIFISSVKDDTFPARQAFFKIMSLLSTDFILEIPLAKARRKPQHNDSKAYLGRQVDLLTEHILRRDPFNL